MRRHAYIRREAAQSRQERETISRFVSPRLATPRLASSRLASSRRALLVQSSSSDEALENRRELAKGDFNGGSLVKMRILDLT